MFIHYSRSAFILYAIQFTKKVNVMIVVAYPFASLSRDALPRHTYQTEVTVNSPPGLSKLE